MHATPLPRRRAARALEIAAVALVAGCVSARPMMTPSVSANGGERPMPAGPCEGCGSASSMDATLAAAIEHRIADLKTLGGDCATYGAVLESSYRSGQITLRPFMWRVGNLLASGEGKPDGTVILAREIDSLNVGVRTVDEMLWTLEHEAAHIAFNITNGADAADDRANARVRACRPARP